MSNLRLAHAVDLMCGNVAPLIKLVPKKIEECKIRVRDEGVTIEHPDKVKKVAPVLQLIEREIFRQALVERAISTLRYFARAGEIEGSAVDELRFLAESVSGPSVKSEADIRAVILATVKERAEDLIDAKDRLLDKLSRLTPAQFNRAQHPEEFIRSTGFLVQHLVALSLLLDPPKGGTPSFGQDVVETKARKQVIVAVGAALQTIEKEITARWARALFDGDTDKAKQAILLRMNLRDSFRADGFYACLPPLFTESSLDGSIYRASSTAPSAISAAHARRRQSFPVDLERATSAFVEQSSAILAYDAKLRATHIAEEDVGGYIRERIVDLTPGVLPALKQVGLSLPTELPSAVTDFVEAVCLLRFHGGLEGLAMFCTLACFLNEQEFQQLAGLQRSLNRAMGGDDDTAVKEAAKKMEEFLVERSDSHPEDYRALLELLATWNLCRNDDQRDALYTSMKGRMSAMMVRTVYTIGSGLLHSFDEAMRERSIPCNEIVRKLRRDVWGVTRAARDTGDPNIVQYVTRIASVARSLLGVFQVENFSPAKQERSLWILEKLIDIQQQQRTTDPARGAAIERAINYATALKKRIEHETILTPDSLIERVERGRDSKDIEVWIDALAKGVDSASHTSEPDVAARLTMIVQEKTRELVDAISDDWVATVSEMDSSVDGASSAFLWVRGVLDARAENQSRLSRLRRLVESEWFPDSAQWRDEIEAIDGVCADEVVAILLRHDGCFRDFLVTLDDIHRLVDESDAPTIADLTLLRSVLSTHEARDSDRAALWKIARGVAPSLFPIEHPL